MTLPVTPSAAATAAEQLGRLFFARGGTDNGCASLAQLASRVIFWAAVQSRTDAEVARLYCLTQWAARCEEN
jgi:hypothetical protein